VPFLAKKISVLVIDGKWGVATAVIRCLAANPGVRIHLFSSDPKGPIRYSRHVTTFLHHSSRSEDELEEKVRHAALTTRSELLLASSAVTTEFLIRRGAGIPNTRLMRLPRLQSFRTANDKWAFHLAAQACSASSPRTWRADDQGSLEHAAFPLLLKPRIGQGGVGIVRANNMAELLTARRLSNVTPGSHIIQEFIPGKDIGCSVFCEEGRIVAWTAQEAIQPGMTEFGPALTLRFLRHQGAFTQAAKIVESLNWSGVANFDMRVRDRDGELFLLEMNPRFWASIHGSLRAGIDFVGLNSSLVQPASGLMANTRQLDYYQGFKALAPWLRGCATDLGCRLCDPLPDLMRKIHGLKERFVCGDGKRVLPSDPTDAGFWV
jgi:D-aspartate ligase